MNSRLCNRSRASGRIDDDLLRILFLRHKYMPNKMIVVSTTTPIAIHT